MIKNKKNILLAFVVGVVTFSGTVFALNTVATGYDVSVGAWKDVYFSKGGVGESTTGMRVRNDGASKIFVPTKTNAEFSSFFNNPPSGVYMYKQYYTGGYLSGGVSNYAANKTYAGPAWSVFNGTSEIMNLYVPATGDYRFYMNIQREKDQKGETFDMYVKTNGSWVKIFRSNDTGTDDHCYMRWQWGTTNGNGTGTQAHIHLTKGYHEFKMVGIPYSQNYSVEIYHFRMYSF